MKKSVALGGPGYWRDAIFSHSAYRRLKRNTGLERGYTIEVRDRNKPDTTTLVYMAGITSTLRDQFWPKYVYKAAPKHVPGVPRADNDNVIVLDDADGGKTQKKKQKKAGRRRSQKLIRADAMLRGSIIHAQVAQYTRYLSKDVKTTQEKFDNWLSDNEQQLHPAARRIILSFNEASGMRGDAPVRRFYPIWSELPVCDMWNLNTAETRVPWATKVDSIVYDTETHSLTLVELKTSSADFEVGTNQMSAPLSWMIDSPLNQARVQLAVTTQLFRRTYGSILQGVWLKGMIVLVTPDGDYSKRWFMDEEHEMRDILQSLGSVFWFKKGKLPTQAVK